jgi:transposase-like protein
MRKSRFSEEQIIAILKQHQAGVPVADLCRKHGIIPGLSDQNRCAQSRNPRDIMRQG